jgi:HlyD family secretion protein
MRKLIRRLFALVRGLARENTRLLLGIALTALLGIFLTVVVIAPAWKDPKSKFYGSKLGYPSVMRKLGRALPVEGAAAKPATFERWIMGEGTCASIPLLAPVIPMAMVKNVLVKPGDRVTAGQVIARIDPALAKIKLESAKLAVETARAELARVQLGSAYVLAQERPEMEKVNLTAQEELASQAEEKVTKYREAFQRGAVSRTALLAVEGEFTEATRMLEKARLQMAMSEKGVKESHKIAENAVKDAEKAVNRRVQELKDYEVLAPGAGVVERALINPGEYNQDSGKPGFVIASGRWFEAYFDQADFADVKQGLDAWVHLEAFPGRPFPGKVTTVVPVVSFNQGGPETTRPLRPRGSGAAEWAATFSARIDLDSDPQQIALGMTGFARLRIHRENLGIPRGALVSISAGSGYVYVLDGDERWQSRLVEVGLIEETKVEILSGLSEGDRVIVRGHWALEPGDKIRIERTWDGFTAPEKR